MRNGMRGRLEQARRGRVQQLLSAVAAGSALALGAEIYFEHYKGSFADRWMWTPILATPPLVVAGVAGVFSERAARTALPVASAVFAVDGAVGVVTHLRGVLRKPGGAREPLYNLVMGPPLLAPGSLALVGAIGIAAAFADRER
ncbi:MAG: hypothetical protein ACTHNU_17965 [Gaiellales bacterium]